MSMLLRFALFTISLAFGLAVAIEFALVLWATAVFIGVSVIFVTALVKLMLLRKHGLLQPPIASSMPLIVVIVSFAMIGAGFSYLAVRYNTQARRRPSVNGNGNAESNKNSKPGKPANTTTGPKANTKMR